jgi:TPR repeat protein
MMFLPALSQADGLFDFQMKLAQKGNAEAQFKVGEMYETGFGVKQDMNEAMSWITRANEQGHETAGFKLLYWDVEKNKITDANKAKVEALKTKAKEGNGQAQYYLGKMYARGVGVKKNTNEAINWLNKAALVGVLEAEREVVLVREDKQRQILAKRRADEKKRAELKVKQERDRQARLEQQRAKQEAQRARHEEQRKLQERKSLEAKSSADEKSRQSKAAAEARIKADKDAAAKAQILAQKQAEDKQREAQKQALLKKRESDQKKRKTQFESDPCSGKSARFLSTCK